ncbi:hypothetical protein HMPREF3226_01508 [Prevotella corporis]|uniref:Uncharacterized protein n=1 Tax=Prevotella corporis TaxID=28128 RepID=A0A133Q718_9BACT|nr:hypothetical protein HMPREF3226_01508 [Prevotella corporis]
MIRNIFCNNWLSFQPYFSTIHRLFVSSDFDVHSAFLSTLLAGTSNKNDE